MTRREAARWLADYFIPLTTKAGGDRARLHAAFLALAGGDEADKIADPSAVPAVCQAKSDARDEDQRVIGGVSGPSPSPREGEREGACCHGNKWSAMFETHDSPAEWRLCRDLAASRRAVEPDYESAEKALAATLDEIEPFDPDNETPSWEPKWLARQARAIVDAALRRGGGR